jgi:hypothetical protein
MGLLTLRDEELHVSVRESEHASLREVIFWPRSLPRPCKFGLRKLSTMAHSSNYCSNYVTADQAIPRLLDQYVLFFTIDWIANLQNPNTQKCRFSVNGEEPDLNRRIQNPQNPHCEPSLAS